MASPPSTPSIATVQSSTTSPSNFRRSRSSIPDTVSSDLALQDSSYTSAFSRTTSNLQQQRRISSEDVDHLPDDGPLFRATLQELESKTANLKNCLKRTLKAAAQSLELSKMSLEADIGFFDALRGLTAADPLLTSYLGDISPTSSGSFDKTRQLKENLQHQMQVLLIDPLRKLYESDIKAAESKKKHFEEESKDYYAFLSKYLSIKQDGHRIKKKMEYEAKYQSKKKQFDLTRFDYYAFMHDLHGGRKEKEILYHLVNYYEKQYVYYQQVSLSIADLKPGLDNLNNSLEDSLEDIHNFRKEREERRRVLETKPTTVDPFIYIFPENQTITDETTDGKEGQEGELGPDKFKGIRDLEHQDLEQSASMGRKKEGFLFATSRPSQHAGIADQRIKQLWHKYWCVLSNGFLHEYSNWKKQLETHNEPINLRFASVREARNVDRRFCFEVLTPQYRRLYQATSPEDLNSWITTINNAIEGLLNGTASVYNFNSFKAPPTPTGMSGWLPSSPLSPSMPDFKSVFADSATIELDKDKDGDNNINELASKSTTTISNARHSLQLSPGGNVASNGENATRIRELFREDKSNCVCAECGSKNPEWCSINLGILVCIECSGIHRSLGTHVSKVRSLTLDKASYTPDLVAMMQAIGNERSNTIWEAKLSAASPVESPKSPTATSNGSVEEAPSPIKTLHKPTANDSRDVKQKFITAKYIDKAFVDRSISNSEFQATDLLFEAIDKNDIPLAMHALTLGARVNSIKGPAPSRSVSTSSSSGTDSPSVTSSTSLGSKQVEPNVERAADTASVTSATSTSATGTGPHLPKYPLQFAFLHPVTTTSSQEQKVYPMAEFLMQNGADSTMVDPDTGKTVSELIVLSTGANEDVITYLNAKHISRGQTHLVQPSLPPLPPLPVSKSTESKTENKTENKVVVSSDQAEGVISVIKEEEPAES